MAPSTTSSEYNHLEEDFVDDASATESDGQADGEGGQADGEGGNANGEAGGGAAGAEDDQPADPLARGRGHSLGIYGTPPETPHRIRLVNLAMDSSEAHHTLRSIMRAHWLLSCFNVTDLEAASEGRWFKEIAEEFGHYYTFDPEKGSAEDAAETIDYHMREKARKMVTDEKRRVTLAIKNKGGTARDHRPLYFSSEMWRGFIRHWEDPDFMQKSIAASESRAQIMNPHTSGARSFDRRAWDFAASTGKKPIKFTLFVELHSKKSGEYTSPHVKKLVEKIMRACQRKGRKPERMGLKRWAMTVGDRKNTILGVPHVKHSDIIPHVSKRPRIRRDVASTSTAGSATSLSRNPLYASAVERTVAYARAHPEEFDLTEDQIRMLSGDVVHGDSELPEDHPLRMETMRQVVQVLVYALEEVLATQPRPKGKNRAPPPPPGDKSDDDARPPPPPPKIPRKASSGPKIKG